MNVWLANFPLPPSVNEYMMPIRTGYGKSRFVKTQLHRQYMQACQLWALQNRFVWYDVQKQLKDMVLLSQQHKRRFGLRVDCYFVFESSRLFTLDQRPKSLDADNRLKPCRDALARLLSIDDKYFFSGFFEKISTDVKDKECTFLKISPMHPRKLVDLQMEIQKERASSLSDSSQGRP